MHSKIEVNEGEPIPRVDGMANGVGSGLGPQASKGSKSDEPLAIVGFSARFPGEATSEEGFWKLLCEARTAHGKIPADRMNADTLYHPNRDRSDTVSFSNASDLSHLRLTHA